MLARAAKGLVRRQMALGRGVVALSAGSPQRLGRVPNTTSLRYLHSSTVVQFASPPPPAPEGKVVQVKKTLWERFKLEVSHYKHGMKLFGKELVITSRYIGVVSSGGTLNRRQRQQLVRTSADLMRMVPFIFFLIVPFMELLLPVAIRMFPNMLPSTFRNSLQNDEKRKKQLKAQLELAYFMREIMEHRATKISTKDTIKEKDREASLELLKMLEGIKHGIMIEDKELAKFAPFFGSHFKLESLKREHLAAMIQYMGMKANSFANDYMLRVQLRSKLREIKADDKEIMWEGITTLTDPELRVACFKRGIKISGYNYHQQPIPELRQELESWISLSNNNLIPTSLLILSRSLYRVSKDQMTLLKQERQDNILAKTLSEATEVMENIEAAEKHELEQQELESEMSLNEIKLKELEREEQIIREELLAEAREEDVELAESEKKKELEILEDIGEAVSVLSSGSIVQDEKAELQTLAKDIDNEKAFKLQASSSFREGEVDDTQKSPPDSREAALDARLESKVDSMVQNVQESIRKAEKEELTSELKIIDLNRDGKIDLAELRVALALLRDPPSEEVIQLAISELDPDHDGTIQLCDLKAFSNTIQNLQDEQTNKDSLHREESFRQNP